jgi:SAM-dependent methyltransferase
MSRWYESTSHLYDQVDKWTAKYGADAYERLTPDRDGPSGEERFTELVQQSVGPPDTVVDIGTGDAGWLMSEVAPHVRRAVGLDYAARRLWHGARRRTEIDATNVELLLADGRRIPLRDGSCGVLLNRRGPWSYDEAFMREGLRILAPGGLAIEITIGEQNARELDEAFGARSQMHAALHAGEPRLEMMSALYRRFGLEVLVAESHECRETFASREALEFRLETSPTIDGLDLGRDAALMDDVVERHGLSLTVHRLCLVARKG